MAVHGYVTHANHNRRLAGRLVLLYILAFELIGAFALTIVLLFFDPDHTIISDPLGYAVRYALPLALLAAFIFWRQYRGHAKSVVAILGVRIVSRADEPRFVQIAEEQCTALGVRLPRFGLIEVSEPNAVTVGEGPALGLIAVTRGLLDMLDDDELAAVLAHEASHIRQGDTKLLAANHALMRTAVLLQTNNPLRIEDWRQMIVILVLPPILLLLLAGGAITMFSMRLTRMARRGLKLSRDHIADGEAVRVTNFPEALVTALQKVGGRGTFQGSYLVEGLLFDGPTDREGGSHPSARDRIAAITSLGGEMMDPGRRRRDTRQHWSGARPAVRQSRPGLVTAFPRDLSGKPLEQPPTATTATIRLYLFHREAYRDWQNALIAWYEWRAHEQRNALGLTPKVMIPLAATVTFLLVFHWPSDGDLGKLRNVFNPTMLVSLAKEMTSEVTAGPRCEGPSYPDGLCPEYEYSEEQIAALKAKRVREAKRQRASGPWGAMAVPLLMLGFLILAVFKPKALRDLFGVVEAHRPLHIAYEEARLKHESDRLADIQFAERQPPQPSPLHRPGGFGRKGI